MDGKKKMGSSSSSITSDLFGSKDFSGSGVSSSGIFGSIFAPSSKILGRESLYSEAVEKRPDSISQVCTKAGVQDTIPPSSEGENQSAPSKDMSHFYQDQRVHPCHLSSSIYYGGQDIYSHPQNTPGPGHTTITNDGGEDDSGSASRGNWWQGSLYY